MKETRTVEELTNGWDSSSEIKLDENGVFELPINIRLLKYKSELPKGVEYVCCMQNTFGHPFDLYSDGADEFYGVVPWAETLDVEHNINEEKEPADISNDKYKCPTCGYEFNKTDRCPECGQLVKEKENEDMNRKAMEMVMFMTRMFYEYCHKDEIVDTKKMIEMKAEDRDDFIINFVEMAIKDNAEDWQKFLVDEIKESFPIEREGYLIEVEVSRIREVEEKGYINIIVPKTQADSKEDAKTIAEDYVSRYYDEESDIDWEINDEEFNIKDFVVTDSSFENEDTIDNLEARYNVDETIN